MRSSLPIPKHDREGSGPRRRKASTLQQQNKNSTGRSSSARGCGGPEGKLEGYAERGAQRRAESASRVSSCSRITSSPSESALNRKNSWTVENSDSPSLAYGNSLPSRKYSSSTHLAAPCHARTVSSANIEKKISAFKKSRAMSETTLNRRARAPGGSLIPVPVASLSPAPSKLAQANHSPKMFQKHKNTRRLSTGEPPAPVVQNASDTPKSHRKQYKMEQPTEDTLNIQECDSASAKNIPPIQGTAEESRLKSASEKLDMLIMGVPDSSVAPDSAIYSSEYSNDHQDQADWPNCSLPVCLNKANLQSSKSVSTLYSVSVTPTHRKERPLSEEFDDRHFSDSDLKTSNSYPMTDDGFRSPKYEDSKDPAQLAPRFSSLRNKSQDSVIQKFKKSFSLRFHKNKQNPENESSTRSSSPSRSGKASRADSPSQFYYSLDQAGLAETIPSSHPAAVSGVSPMTARRNDISSMSSTSPDSSSLKVVPIVRRASCDEKRPDHHKEIRNSKCNSADSGIQLELLSGANSSQCTQIASAQPKPECGSPVVVRRRPIVTDRRKVKRPLSDLGGASVDPSLLADVMKVGLAIKDSVPNVRRTQSDPANRDYDSSSSQSVDCKEILSPDSGISSTIRTFGNQLKRSSSQPLPSFKASHPSFSPSPCHQGNNILANSSPTPQDKDGEFIEKNGQPHSFAEAVWDHVTLDPEELAFKAGDLVEVVDTTDEDWWWGIMGKRCGWFPASFVWLKVNQEQSFEEFTGESNAALNTSSNSIASQRTSVVSILTNDEIRTNIVNEIISSEKDYVTHLKDVCEGYLNQVWKRPDMFSDEQIAAIFGNIEQIHLFQCTFLKHLESSINWSEPHKSQIGSCFLRHKENFKIYSEYCNNHPQSSSVLQDLYTNEKYVQFFEACRLLQDMIDISLDGFLLTPVQKICKYPLQLAELFNYTKPDHPDYPYVKEALETMKCVAILINERKRRIECLEKIIIWQSNIVDWEGPNLIDSSSELIYTGEVNKLTTWSREVCLFLFDHQLVYCKRDLLKRNLYAYRGRINMDTCELTWLDESKDNNLGVKNAWKIFCHDRNKIFVFFTRTSEEKEKWMKAFQKERERVTEDKSQGFVITNKARRQAISAAEKSKMNKRPKVKSMKSQGYLTGPITKQSARSILNEDIHNSYLSPSDDSSLKSRTGSLPHGVSLSVNSCSSGVEKKKVNQGTNSWFSFGSTKKLKR